MDLSVSDFIHGTFLLVAYALIAAAVLQMVWIFIKLAVSSALVDAGHDKRRPMNERRSKGYALLGLATVLTLLGILILLRRVDLSFVYMPRQDPGPIYSAAIALVYANGSAFIATKGCLNQ